MTNELIDGLKFDDKGLVSCIIQDADNGEILMFAFSNREALRLTFETGKMHFYSRSRDKLWLKGESSGHTQDVTEIRVDCDMDALLIKVRQHGGACHVGYRSCFYRRKTEAGWQIEGEKIFNPDEVYKK